MDDVNPTDLGEILHLYLERAHEGVMRTLEGLDEYDVRRPLTPTGTNLLGLVKHLASVELGYLGDCVGRPSGIDLPWDNEEGYRQSADMWARAEESREFVEGLYRSAWAHSAASISELGVDAPAVVEWWPEERRHTTLGRLLVHLTAETAQHAGHCDIVREMIDGRAGRDHDDMGDAEFWSALVARIQSQADAHRHG